MRFFKKVCLILSVVILAGCTPSKKETATLVGLGHTFRDLRQHTFSTSSDINYSWVDISPDAQKMAVVMEKDGNRDIFIKSINGKAMTQKTFHPGDDSYPVFSPDGSKLAFASRRSGNWDIFVMNTNKGKAKRQISFSSDMEIAPSWSPDGKKIAFSRLSSVSNEWEIWTYNLENSALTNLVPGQYPVYSPIDNRIVFQRPTDTAKGGWYALWIIDDEGNQETVVLSSQEEGYITPSWSDDGSRIVFASGGKHVKEKVAKLVTSSGKTTDVLRDIRKANDIWTVKVDGTSLTQLTTHEKTDYSPCWAMDGRIFFASNRDRYNNIWSVIPEFVDLSEPVIVE